MKRKRKPKLSDAERCRLELLDALGLVDDEDYDWTWEKLLRVARKNDRAIWDVHDLINKWSSYP